MFEGLQDKFQEVFKRLKGEGKISEEHLAAALKQIRLALLEADVHFRVVKVLLARVEEKDPQLAEEFFRAFVTSAGITLHVKSLSGKNGHHVLEASFKGVARALRDAVRVEGGDIPSTKEVL
jgi:imidazoleglycerol phosphate dehydratase HisB